MIMIPCIEQHAIKMLTLFKFHSLLAKWATLCQLNWFIYCSSCCAVPCCCYSSFIKQINNYNLCLFTYWWLLFNQTNERKRKNISDQIDCVNYCVMFNSTNNLHRQQQSGLIYLFFLYFFVNAFFVRLFVLSWSNFTYIFISSARHLWIFEIRMANEEWRRESEFIVNRHLIPLLVTWRQNACRDMGIMLIAMRW